MKKYILLILSILFITTTGFSQASTDVSVTADVLQQITVTKQADLDFGSVSKGFSHTIDAKDPGSAKLTITGADQSTIYVEVPSNITLSSAGDSMPLTVGTPAHNSVDDRGSATSFSSTSDTFASNGTDYLYIGGTIDATTATAGSYSGTLTITVSYQ